MNEFEKLLVLLAGNKIRFITVGGFACAFNGVVRATEDIDLLIEHSPANVRLLLETLSGYGEGFARELSEDDFTDEEGAIRLVEQFPIDLFVRMSGFRYLDFEKDIQYASIHGEAIPYLNRNALIRLKENSLREIDQQDVLQLRRSVTDDSQQR